jgi:signal transduction histidine kinase
VADLERLASRSGDGPAVTVLLTGDVDNLPEPIGAAIYRLAQESVTNARRHARHATTIEVHVAVDDTSVRLRVTDDGDAGMLRSTPAGFGLIGMRERADLLGGVCQAGPNPGRGWTVTAVLPRAGAAA